MDDAEQSPSIIISGGKSHKPDSSQRGCQSPPPVI